MISVYITNYNYGQFITEAIESVLSQENVDFELLIIDDGSTDNSKEIIERYREKDKVTIIYQQNKGLNITNNIALQLANGKYIMRLDADDYLEPDALYKLSQPLEADSTIGLVFPDYYIVDAVGQELEHHKRHDFRKEVTLYDQAAHGACTMIRVDYLRELGGYNENYKCQDGYELWIKFTSKHKVVNVSEPLFNYRQHGSNLTSNENKILSTRAQINADYISSLNINNQAIAVIPVRSKKDKHYRLEIDNKSLLNVKIEQALKSQAIKKVIISSPDEEVKNEISDVHLNNDRIVFHKRSENLARINTSLSGTVMELQSTLPVEDTEDISAIVILDLRFPLISNVKIDDAVNTMLLFRADSLISVRQDSSMFFKHDGTGMKSILDHGAKSKLERDVLYRHVGGITVTNFQSFLTKQEIIHGKVGHVVLDKNSSYEVENKQDLEVIQQINKLYQII